MGSQKRGVGERVYSNMHILITLHKQTMLLL
jgi:hypothetical protein